ncbi:type II secretion system protein [Solirubrobacter sp. CPCC 204708]|uniref:Type II secretion system GspH family protein n=1 Tax=Solirubrobacter deserti TaxID=2282478 RepID=A0ABT4RPN6_9ACTN|nr:type II secretion system protein [Solirubrobacter deserti]MBE2316606.1 type II secretion system protein [Solirubrobacter deserti]MDA0140504.1 type II secretion system GspH family protein [Solirubrobacter deserti]
MRRLRAEEGYSLVELMVVVLIVGVLAAVAVPTLLGQRAKAQDTGAKAATVTAAKAAIAFGTDRGGFEDATPEDLARVEKSLADARGLRVEGASRTFTVSVDSASGTTFSIARAEGGEITRDCTPAGSGGCRETADARGNRW